MADTSSFIDSELHIRCADAVELATDYLDDALSASDLLAFEAHLAECEGCSIFVDQIKMTITLVSATSRSRAQLMPSNFDQLLATLARTRSEP